jgi:hypothetical protein
MGHPDERGRLQPSALGITSRMASIWMHSWDISPPGVGGERGFIAGCREKGVQRGDHLCPSPTAAATHLTDPERTSPIANTPGKLVSSGLRGLASVRTKPLSSSATSDRDNHAVFGSAPINKDRWRIARLTSSLDRREGGLSLSVGNHSGTTSH